ncbi:flagellin [Devosia rhodophyticola]|uniref:Flagellin n=1 Tax=Devosia rhodophyticola TaxID=3026423 RepID=A0ABY7YWK7_9HYPH|nr:flagellin [Devosia rhodophyticola]WDR05410.1 flagellin [Devosia rhodophyticola]
MIVNKSMYPLQTGFSAISRMQDALGTLQKQLGSGQKASNLSEMGRDLPMSLSVRARLSKIEGYSANIDTVNLRLSFLDNSMSRFDAIEGEARSAAMTGQYGTDGINLATGPGLSTARFDEIVTMLNEQVAGRYLFGGKATDKAPLPDSTTLLNGAGGKLGFTGLRDLRQAADGVNDAAAPGRLTSTIDPLTPAVVNLTEDGSHPFGFKLSTISTTAPTTINVSGPTLTDPLDPTSAKQMGVEFTGLPTPGQVVSIGLTMPDGTETQVKLTATADNPPAAGAFTIDADPAIMASNFQAALDKSLGTAARTDLKAASTFAAANDFFSEDGVPRIPAGGPPATSLAPDATDSAIHWYTGEVGTPGDNPRQSITAATDETSKVDYGVRANESGFLRLIRSQAAMAVSDYPSEGDVRAKYDGDRVAAMGLPEGAGRDSALAAYEAKVAGEYRESTGFFDGMAQRQLSELSEGHNSEAGSIEIITMQMGVAHGALESASKRHDDYKTQLENLLSDTEGIDENETAMSILALQTRLQASYQVTSMVSQLSLVNYLR